MLKAHKSAPVEEEVQVVEIEPVYEEEDGEAKPAELPTADEPEEEESEDLPTPAEEAAPEETPQELEAPSEEEKSRMDEILNAIKTFFPNENTEDVLVRVVSKLIDR